MRRASAYLLVLVVLLAGCGGSPESNDGSASSDASSTSRSSPRDSELPTESTGGPVPEESDRPTSGDEGEGEDGNEDEGDGDGDDEDERVLEVGGPTLDNTYPTNPFALPYVGGSSCVLFSNRTSDVTVTVHSVRLINLQPPEDPGLELGTEPSEHPQCSNQPAEQTWTVYANCSEAKLEPNAATACPVEVRSIGTIGTDYTARLILRLSATCTDLVGEPCDRLVGRAAPTATQPITVTWEDSRRYSSCLVPRERGGAEFLPEEGDGRCPLDTATASPSETSDGSSQEPGIDDEAESEPPASDDETESQEPETGDPSEGERPGPGNSEVTEPTSRRSSYSPVGG